MVDAISKINKTLIESNKFRWFAQHIIAEQQNRETCPHCGKAIDIIAKETLDNIILEFKKQLEEETRKNQNENWNV
jgi:hypothetical protein